MPMTPRERVLATLAHDTPDRVPIVLGPSNATGIKMVTYRRIKALAGIEAPDEYLYEWPELGTARLDEATARRLHADVRPVLDHFPAGVRERNATREPLSPHDRRLGQRPGLRRTGRLVPGDPPAGGRLHARGDRGVPVAGHDGPDPVRGRPCRGAAPARREPLRLDGDARGSPSRWSGRSRCRGRTTSSPTSPASRSSRRRSCGRRRRCARRSWTASCASAATSSTWSRSATTWAPRWACSCRRRCTAGCSSRSTPT